MHPAPLDACLAVAPQIAVAEVAGLASAGFRLIIANRPDGEADEQPAADAIAAEARRLGLAFVHLPVSAVTAITDADVAAFDAAVRGAAGPVLAYCRTGTRSTALWALAEAGRRPVDAVLDDAGRAGYALDALRPRLETIAARRGDAAG